jgi:hypothetical protein
MEKRHEGGNVLISLLSAPKSGVSSQSWQAKTAAESPLSGLS